VSHGTLVCLKCAGRHRTLGVHVSRIKSLTMDAWEPTHVTAMLLGGNGQLKGFLERQGVPPSDIETLYTRARAADFYRTELAKQVSLELDKAEVGSRNVLDEVPLPAASPTAPQRKHSPDGNDGNGGAAGAAASPLGVAHGLGTGPLPPPSSPFSAAIDAAVALPSRAEHFEAIVPGAELGLTLVREVTPFGNLSRVARVVPGGAAALGGVVVGDYISGAGGRMIRWEAGVARIRVLLALGVVVMEKAQVHRIGSSNQM